MSTLRFRRVTLRVETGYRPYGVTIPFEAGLNLIQGPNSTGKSTSVQAVLFGLGMEGMLSSSHDVPLPYAMTDLVRDPESGEQVPVLESYVELEIANEAEQRAVLRRYSKHASIDHHVISIRDASPDVAPSLPHDLFVRRPGAAQAELGFHHWLSRFVGWELPTVQKFDGSDCPLYVETLFPFLFVEQKRGWAGVGAQLPGYLGIRDAGKRAVEFVLDLDASSLLVRRQHLLDEQRRLRDSWRETRSKIATRAAEFGVALAGVPDAVRDEWPDRQLDLLAPSRDAWVSVEGLERVIAAELDALEALPAESAERAAPRLQEQLNTWVGELQEVAAAHGALLQSIAADREQAAVLERRDHTIDEELRRLQDIVMLRQLGASSGIAGLLPDDCPTCSQALPPHLLDPHTGIEAIPVDDGVMRLREERSLVRAMLRDVEAVVEAKELRRLTLDQTSADLQGRIRAAKETLIAPSSAPSEEAVAQRLALRERLAGIDRLRSAAATAREELSRIHDEAAEVERQLRELINLGSLSAEDREKLHTLATTFLSELRQYGFGSLPVEDLTISEDTYLPTHAGFDLGFNISASDMIRVIWAYLIAILEIDRSHATNHPGCLVLDEPRQQSADKVSFEALLRRASMAGAAGQQVIFATSEPVDDLQRMLSGSQYSLTSFDAPMLRRLR